MVHNDTKAFPELCKLLTLFQISQKLIHWAHWITPEIEKKRFDTQFFLTVLPEYVGGDKDLAKALVSADGQETLFLEWMTPKEALDAFSKGVIRLFPPQYLTLLELMQMNLITLDAHLPTHLRTTAPSDIPMISRTVEAFLPEPILHHESSEEGGIPAMALPGDELHSTAESKGLGNSGARHRVIISRDLDEAKKKNEEAGAKRGEVGAVAGITNLRVVKRGPSGAKL
ncbi:hypothetical protein BC829DRAFT_401804 [Chytridium lagenaria]|nr:hypothetical protein BC829DRAFT_401804 [Chytridium lagenaria]